METEVNENKSKTKWLSIASNESKITALMLWVTVSVWISIFQSSFQKSDPIFCTLLIKSNVYAQCSWMESTRMISSCGVKLQKQRMGEYLYATPAF